SDVLGPIAFGKKEEAIFLGREIAQHRDYSEQTAQTIDREIRDTVERNYRRAREIITTKLPILHDLAKALLEYETIDGEEVERIVNGLKIERPPVETTDTSSPAGAASTPSSGRTETGGG